ncbi:MAG: hypothetical protein ACW99Q_13725 [Candidatus Kariarchaeaceae archaeon]|jgi:hypothetical protein
MNTILVIAAVFSLVVSFAFVILYPFWIGKARSDLTYTASGYINGLVQATLYVLMAGRIFGWW